MFAKKPIVTTSEAINLYYEGAVEKALLVFQDHLSKGDDKQDSVDLELWVVNCFIKLKRFSEAQKILHSLLQKSDLLPSHKRRALFSQAEIYLENYEFEKIFLLFENLVTSESTYEDLAYLDYRVDDAIEAFENFQRYGKKDDFKEEILKKIQSVMKTKKDK